MIRISLILISIFSLLYDLVFFFTPFFLEMTNAETTNIVCLEILEVQYMGYCLLDYFLFIVLQQNYDLFTIITVTSNLQNLA